MNTEQQLRRASDEMERVTASLTPPPLGVLQRSARARAAEIAAATAVGVVLVVGGVVLALNPRGETTLVPAGPMERTFAPMIVDGIPLIIPDLDPAPEFDSESDAHEHSWQPPGDGVNVIRELISDPDAVDQWLGAITEIVFAGGGGEYFAFELVGEYGSGAGPGRAGLGACLVTYGLGDKLTSFCGSAGDRSSRGGAVDMLGGPTFIVSGRAQEGSSVVVLEVDEDQHWSRTRDGYVVMAVSGNADSVARYYVDDAAGNELAATTLRTGEETVEQPAVTLVPAVEDDGSCSATGHYSDRVLDTDLPEPVVQTLGKILLFADRCWLEDLANVAAESFTASFGGGDPAELWAFQEEQSSEPMAALLEVLDMPYGTTVVEGRTLYIWPAAAAHDGDWDSMPQEDKDALLSLYTEADLAAFSDWGGYIGYRLGIYEDVTGHSLWLGIDHPVALTFRPLLPTEGVVHPRTRSGTWRATKAIVLCGGEDDRRRVWTYPFFLSRHSNQGLTGVMS